MIHEPAPAPDSGSGALQVLGALGTSVTDRTKKLLGAYFLGAQAYKVAKKWYDRAQERRTYTIAVPGDDAIYEQVHGWLLERLPPQRRRSMIAKSGRTSGMDVVPVGDTVLPPELRLLYDGNRTQTVTLDGHEISVQVENPDARAFGVVGGDDDRRWFRRYERIVFTAPSLAAREAVLRFLDEIALQQSKRPPKLYVAQPWGSWVSMSDVPHRTLDTVVLRRGQKEALVDDLRRFLSQEGEYVRLGVPWHRGYLFHGKAGTGKTSIAKALATSLGLDVYYMPLSSLRDDSVLIELFTRVEKRSILLLEDVDVTHATHEATDGRPGVTMQGLLNALDGFITPYGLITMMTTNHIDKLDDRIIRPGRADVKVCIDELDDTQFGDLVEAMVGWRPELPPLDGRSVTPATIVEAIKAHIGDVDAAVAAVVDVVTAGVDGE